MSEATEITTGGEPAHEQIQPPSPQEQSQPPAVTIPAFTVNSDETHTFSKEWRNSAAIHPAYRGENSRYLERFPSMHALTKFAGDQVKNSGRDKVMVPTEHSTEEELAEFYTKIGVPESPDKYQWENKLPEGMEPDEEQAKWFRDLAHGVKLTPTQAKQVAEAFNERMGGKIVEAQQAQAEAEQKQIEDVADWVTKNKVIGQNRVKETNQFAQNAFNEGAELVEELGFDRNGPEVQAAIKKIQGDKVLYSMFSKFGRSYQEHGIAGVGTEYVQTQAGTDARIAAIEKDMAAMKKGDGQGHLKPEYQRLAKERQSLIHQKAEQK